MEKCENAQVNGFIKMTVKITRIIDVSQLQLVTRWNISITM